MHGHFLREDSDSLTYSLTHTIIYFLGQDPKTSPSIYAYRTILYHAVNMRNVCCAMEGEAGRFRGIEFWFAREPARIPPTCATPTGENIPSLHKTTIQPKINFFRIRRNNYLDFEETTPCVWRWNGDAHTSWVRPGKRKRINQNPSVRYAEAHRVFPSTRDECCFMIRYSKETPIFQPQWEWYMEKDFLFAVSDLPSLIHFS
jgi:hypothetical protein